jgi:N-acyl-L-homoserine lactone synthetase
MNASNPRKSAYVFRGFDDAVAQQAVGRFRKRLFVDRLGWALTLDGACEVDQFDTDETVYASVSDGDQIVGAFRAIRSDKPYLAQAAFPNLATTRPYPARPDVWEISRFGVLPGIGSVAVASTLYALMFQFALMRRAKALVAVTDLFHERQLSRRGIRTRRYGKPAVVGFDSRQRPIMVVAGEIPIEKQEAAKLRDLLANLNGVMIYDQTLVFGRSRISA